jgi:hypothetical protein
MNMSRRDESSAVVVGEGTRSVYMLYRICQTTQCAVSSSL